MTEAQEAERRAEAALGRQPADPQGRGRRPGAGLHRRHARVERDIGERLDALIVRTVPRRAQGGEVEPTLLRQRRRHVVPRVPLLHQVRAGAVLPWHLARSRAAQGSAHPEVRYLDIHEDDTFDEKQLRSWIKQASTLPGEKV